MAIDLTDLRAHPFFAHLPEAPLPALAAAAHHRTVEAGSFLFSEGEEADRFFLLVDGLIVLESHSRGRPVMRIETLHRGDVVGWSWLFPPRRWHFDAYALETTHLIDLPATDILDACNSDRGFAASFYRGLSGVLADRLMHTRVQLMDVYRDVDGGAS